MSTPAVSPCSVTNTPRKRPPGVRERCTVDARVATPGAARRGPARSRADTSGRMPRATRARARGALQAKSGAEENVPADVVASHPKAVGAGARGIAAGVSGGAEDALTREMERELEAIEAERESTDAPPRAISTPTDRRGRRGARARGTHRGGFSARVPQQLLTPSRTPFPPLDLARSGEADRGDAPGGGRFRGEAAEDHQGAAHQDPQEGAPPRPRPTRPTPCVTFRDLSRSPVPS